MKAFLTVLAGAVLAMTQAQETVVASKYLHVPLLMWSQRSTFAAPGAYSNAVLDENKVVETIKGKLTGDSEVFALFLSKNLDAKALSELNGASFVETAVKEAKASEVTPHTTRAGSLKEALKEANIQAPVVKDVDAWLASPEAKTLFTNKKNDLVVVEIPAKLSIEDTDKLIKEASAKILAAAHEEKVDFAFTGNEAETIVSTSRGRRLATAAPATITCEEGYQVGTDSKGKPFCFTHYTRMTPNLLSGLVIGLFFVFLGYIGFGAMHGIQTPTRYPHHGPPKGKEF